MDTPSIYAFDPEAASDEDFELGALGHLVCGNGGRLLDARRTPVTLVAIEEVTGMFEVRVEDFEDRGALWRIPLEWVHQFQFRRGQTSAASDVVERYRAVIRRLGDPLAIAADPSRAAKTLQWIAGHRDAAAEILDRHGFRLVDPAGAIAARTGDTRLFAALGDFLSRDGLLDVDAAFTRSYVSNPWAGEVVKGHAIVAAELGLADFEGSAVRDPSVFEGHWTRARRAEHLVRRAAFTQELWSRTGHESVVVFRASASEHPMIGPRRSTFTSATLAQEVAQEHFAGNQRTAEAVLVRRRLPISALFMTFLESPQLNEPYREAEAVCLGWTPTAY